MSLLKTYTVLIMLISASGISAQIPDTTLCTSNSYSFVFDCVPTLDGEPISNGDRISVFREPDSGIVENYTTLVYSEDAPNSISYKLLDGDTMGITSQSFNFLFTSDNFGCTSQKINYIVDSLHSTACSAIISSFEVSSYQVNVPDQFFCQSDQPSAPVSGLMDTIRSISSTSQNLVIDADNNILPQSSVPGTYQIELNSEQCLTQYSFSVTIRPNPVLDWNITRECDRVIVEPLIDEANQDIYINNEKGDVPAVFYTDTLVYLQTTDQYGCASADSFNLEVNLLEIKNLELEKENAACWKDGSLQIVSGEVNNFIGGYSYRLRNKLTKQVLSNTLDVPEGIYTVEVVDDNDCTAEYKTPVVIEQDCLENYPVFSPDGDNVEDRYFIPYEGSVKIYNREGTELIELQTPAYWDGKDGSGNQLSMGTYFILTDTGKTVNITIVR